MRKIKPNKKSKSKLKISACYIVKNEEKNLSRSIESLKKSVDEIVVVDTGSTDKTIEIAEGYSAKVIKTQWQDDFSAPRNLAIDNATGDWIIFLDADEYFQFPEKVKSTIEKLSNETTIIIPRINIDADDNNKVININNDLRIFRNVSYLRYRGMIHENIKNIEGGSFNHIFGGDDLTILHTGYSSSISRDKYLRNLHILELEIDKYGYRVQQDMSFANCYLGLGEYEKALEYSKRAAENYQSIITNPEAPFIHILKCMYELKYSIEDCLKFLSDTIKLFPQIPFFYDQQGILFEKLKKFKEANESYCRRDIVKVELEIEKMGLQPKHNAELASCYSDMNDSENTLKYAKLAIKSNYRTDRIYRDIIKAMYQLQKPVEDILKIIREAIKYFPNSPEFYSEFGMILLANGKVVDGQSYLQKSVQVWNQLPNKNSCYFAKIANKIYSKLGELNEKD